jgi:hypothetical protein
MVVLLARGGLRLAGEFAYDPAWNAGGFELSRPAAMTEFVGLALKGAGFLHVSASLNFW